jgi:hypothetical protein
MYIMSLDVTALSYYFISHQQPYQYGIVCVCMMQGLYCMSNRLCGLVVTVPGYRSRGPGFDSRRYYIF